MKAVITATVTMYVTDQKEVTLHATRFVQALNNYVEIEKVEIDKIEILDKQREELPFDAPIK